MTRWLIQTRGFELALGVSVLLGALVLYLVGLDWAQALLLALLPYVGRNLWLMTRLAYWIHCHYRLVPPFPLGFWGDIYRTIGQYQQRNRKERKRQLRFQRRFREAANSVPDALVVLNKNQIIEWANPAAMTLMGIHWPQDQGRQLSELFNHPQLTDSINAGDASPLEIAPEHDQSLMLAVQVAPFGERKKQRLLIGRDITKVYHLNLIRRDFIANASHELRTPLTVISGFLETLSESSLTPQSHRRPLQLMHKNTQRMRSITDDLLTLSRLELDHQVVDLTTVAIADELQLILADAQAVSAGRHQFELDIDSTLGLLGSQHELHSALSNLLLNAVKHTPIGTTISVTWAQQAQGAIFIITDNGLGIAAKHLPRLTERFYRVDKARSRESGGTGLGLAIVKHVLSRHQGYLAISSEEGAGSSFACHFPTRLVRRLTNQRGVSGSVLSAPGAGSLPASSR